MSSTLQIRSIDAELADAARAEAARRRLTVSDYLKDLITRDLAARSATERRREVYAQISSAPSAAPVSSDTLLGALDEVRRGMGTA